MMQAMNKNNYQKYWILSTPPDLSMKLNVLKRSSHRFFRPVQVEMILIKNQFCPVCKIINENVRENFKLENKNVYLYNSALYSKCEKGTSYLETIIIKRTKEEVIEEWNRRLYNKIDSNTKNKEEEINRVISPHVIRQSISQPLEGKIKTSKYEFKDEEVFWGYKFISKSLNSTYCYYVRNNNNIFGVTRSSFSPTQFKYNKQTNCIVNSTGNSYSITNTSINLFHSRESAIGHWNVELMKECNKLIKCYDDIGEKLQTFLICE